MSDARYLRVAVAQLPNVIGDLDGNAERILTAMERSEDAGADVLVLPELILTGYGLGDLVQYEEFVADAEDVLQDIAGRAGRVTTVLSTIDRVPPQRSWDTRDRNVAICAAMLCDGEVRGRYRKVLLPAYDMFEEARNFAPGNQPDQLWRIGDVVAGVSICEDLWSSDGPPEAQSAAGAQILLVPNASAFYRGKADGRLSNTREVAVRNGLPVVYVNFVGGQDQLAFDGGSIIVDADGELLYRAEEFEEEHFLVDVPVADERPVRGPITNVHTRPVLRAEAAPTAPVREPMSEVETVWHAIVTALRDYVERNGFRGVALGLSGGIDSAVTAALAADAVGPEGVLALAMPSRETTEDETLDAKALAHELGVTLEVVPVEPPSSEDDVPEGVEGGPRETRYTRERRYSRARAAILGDIFEERRYLVLTTGNKSEISIGEASLFGDLAGGFAPLKDCPKTLVHELARYRNGRGQVFPRRTLERQATTWHFAPDGLPSHEVLDEIVERYVEHGQGVDEIVEAGFDQELVEDVLGRIDDAELIRRYAPPGVKVTSRAFDQDRRMPISNGWRPHGRVRG
jgi:NAD+ synthase (glutamine-hydrolysing)